MSPGVLGKKRGCLRNNRTQVPRPFHYPAISHCILTQSTRLPEFEPQSYPQQKDYVFVSSPPPESHQKSGRVLRTKTQPVPLQDSCTQPPGTPGSAQALRLLSSILQLLSIVLLSVGNLTPFYYPEQSLLCVYPLHFIFTVKYAEKHGPN